MQKRIFCLIVGLSGFQVHAQDIFDLSCGAHQISEGGYYMSAKLSGPHTVTVDLYTSSAYSGRQTEYQGALIALRAKSRGGCFVKLVDDVREPKTVVHLIPGGIDSVKMVKGKPIFRIDRISCNGSGKFTELVDKLCP